MNALCAIHDRQMPIRYENIQPVERADSRMSSPPRAGMKLRYDSKTSTKRVVDSGSAKKHARLSSIQAFAERIPWLSSCSLWEIRILAARQMRDAVREEQCRDGRQFSCGCNIANRKTCSSCSAASRKGSKPHGGNPPFRGSVHESPVRRVGRTRPSLTSASSSN